MVLNKHATANHPDNLGCSQGTRVLEGQNATVLVINLTPPPGKVGSGTRGGGLYPPKFLNIKKLIKEALWLVRYLLSLNTYLPTILNHCHTKVR